MSATGRTQGLRSPNDLYVTPSWSIERILEVLDLPISHHGVLPAYWFDPCAASGELIRATNAWLGPRGNVRWHACELRPECAPILHTVANPVVIGDFLKVVPAHYDVVLTNPPYSLAEEFIRACVPVAQHTVMLLRLNWLEGHAELFKQFPADFWVLPNRPAFARNKRGKIACDATAYCWVHWHPGATGLLRWLARTHKDVRAAYNQALDAKLPAYVPMKEDDEALREEVPEDDRPRAGTGGDGEV